VHRSDEFQGGAESAPAPLAHETDDERETEASLPFHPYLYFSGTCREAFTRYQEIFGGELVLLPMSDAPIRESVPADQRHLIMHAALTVGDALLMGSDDPTGEGGPCEAWP
jgi:hypothetical protein